MSPDDREAWWDKIIAADDWSDRNVAAEALLDRVEQLERELAAAPELLAACKTAIAAYDEAYQGKPFKAVWRGEDVDAMRAAIAKAESPGT